jgi:hypothetical protein
MAAPAVRLTVGLVALLLLVGCGDAATATPGSPTTNPPGSHAAGPVRVTLGIYSGRADPTWTLADADAAALDVALASLSGVVGTPPVGGLGYHGFTIEGPEGTVIAFDGAVAPAGDGDRAYLADPGRTIERLLLETARPHVAGNELAEVERALAAP